jgi:nitrogen regulatory protein PII
MRMEIVVVNDRLAQDVVDAIAKAASISDAERIGSGSIFVTPLEQWVRIPAGAPPAAPKPEVVGGTSRRAS